jgi:archaellin
MPKRHDRGLTSLDTLILFIALVIVTSVAAIVLITTGASLQQKELAQSVEARKGVAAGLEVVNVIGTDPSPQGGTPHEIENLYIMVRLLPGTITIPLNNTLLLINIEGREKTLSFNTSCESECNAASTAHYNVFYLKEGSAHENGYVNIGDVAKLTVRLPERIKEDESVKVSMVPAHGPKTTISFESPQNMIVKMQTLWPVA